ncbi:MAG: phosphatidate cytidylyltransferase [Actinomycetota bacterium]
MDAVQRQPDRKLVAGVILGGVALGCIFVSEVTLFVLVLALALIAAGELLRLARSRGTQPAALVALVAVAGAYVVAYMRDVRAPEELPAVVGGALILSAAAVLFRSNRAGAVTSVASTVFVVVYVGAMGAFIIAMRGMHDGFRIVLVFGLMVVLNDAGAWAVGRRAGRHALAPSISPEKSWEGFLGGTVFTFGVGILAGIGLDPPMTARRGLVLAVLVAIAAPLGDLFESMLKRDFGVKDAGGVIPAHGGALDRLDSLIFTAPLFFYAFRALTS